jgi:hypothetical protein
MKYVRKPRDLMADMGNKAKLDTRRFARTQHYKIQELKALRSSVNATPGAQLDAKYEILQGMRDFLKSKVPGSCDFDLPKDSVAYKLELALYMEKQIRGERRFYNECEKVLSIDDLQMLEAYFLFGISKPGTPSTDEEEEESKLSEEEGTKPDGTGDQVTIDLTDD